MIVWYNFLKVKDRIKSQIDTCNRNFEEVSRSSGKRFLRDSMQVTSRVHIVLLLAVTTRLRLFTFLFTTFTKLLTLPVVNRSFNEFNRLPREIHSERFERLHRFERFKKIYLMRRSIGLYKTFNRVVQNVQ
jgi:hypothetical protein